MPDVQVAPVRSFWDRRRFMNLPWTLYSGDPHWVPPLRDNQRRLLGYGAHPFHEIAEVQTFLARRGGQVVGRIAAIVNHEHNRKYGERRGFFGFFESIDDAAVSHALFDAARDWLAQRDTLLLRGPVNPSMNYECGLLVEGFDDPPTFMMTYNPPYYARLIEDYGFAKAQDLYAYIGYRHQLDETQARLGPLGARIIEMFEVKTRPMRHDDLLNEVRVFLSVYNRSFEGMWGFVPITDHEAAFLAKQLKHLLIPELTVIAEVDGKPVAAEFCLPDYNPRIKAIGGRLFPFGIFTLLGKQKDLKRVRLISTTVVPEYQRYGLGLILLGGLVPKGLEMGMTEAEFSWVTESNELSRGSLEKGGTKRYKTYRIYDLAREL